MATNSAKAEIDIVSEGLTLVSSKNLVFDSFSYHSSAYMFNGMITVADFLNDLKSVDSLNKLYDELCRLED